MAQQGTVRHAHVCSLLKDNGCWFQNRVGMDARQVDGACTMPAGGAQCKMAVRAAVACISHIMEMHTQRGQVCLMSCVLNASTSHISESMHVLYLTS